MFLRKGLVLVVTLSIWFIAAALMSLHFARLALADDDSSEVVTAVETLLDSGAKKLADDNLDEGIADLSKALEFAWKSEDGRLIGNVYRYLGIGLLRNGEIESGQNAINSSLEIYKLMGDGDEMLLTLRGVVTLTRGLQLRDLTIGYLNKTAELYEFLGEFERQAAILEQVLEELKLPAEAETLHDACLLMREAYEKAGNQAGVADAWAGLAFYEELTGDKEQALANYAKAIEGYRKFENRRAMLGKALNASAEILREQGRYRQALPLQEEALSLARGIGLEGDIAQSLNNLALLNQELGNHLQAAKLIAECLELTRKIGSEENLATTLTNAASINRDLGRFDEGIELLAEVFKMANEIEGLEGERRRAGQILSTIYYMKGDPVAAAAAAMIADSRAEREGVELPEASGEQSHNFAISLIAIGKYAKAIDILEAELNAAMQEDDMLGMASAHEGLAVAYEASDQYTSAESHILETIRISEELKDTSGQARSLSNLAAVYMKVGRYYEALDRYDEVSQIIATLKAPQMQVVTLLSMAQVYRHLKHYRLALDKAEQVLALAREYGFGVQVASAQAAMGLINLHMGNYAEAERLYLESASGTEEGGRGVINDGLVEVYLATDRYNTALEELSGVTSELLAGANPGYRLQYYTQRGIANYGAGKANEAVTDFSLATVESETIREQFTGLDSQGFFDAGSYGGRIRPYRGMVEVLAANATSGVKATVTIGNNQYDLKSAVFLFAEKMRGRNLVEKLAQLEYLEMRHVMPTDIQQREKELTERLMTLASEFAHKEEAGGEIGSAELEEFSRLSAEMKAHLAMLRKDYPEYALLFSPGTYSLEEVPVARNEAVLEYVFGLDSVFLFVIKRDEPVTLLKLPVTVSELETRVQVFRDLVLSKRYPAALGHELFNILLGDANSHLGQDDAIVIVPDGILGLLPFEALPGVLDDEGTPSSFLGSVRRVSYAQSASLLTMRRNSKRTSAPKAFFALGDPVFGPSAPRFRGQLNSSTEDTRMQVNALSVGSRARTYKRLPETRLEVTALAAINKVAPRPPNVLLGENATESNLREIDLGEYKILHFATHAEALGIPGLVNEPFLVLNQIGNDSNVDGLLTMSEIMNLRLRSSLVVLAACDTGGGDVFEGDGVASLASAFQFAGAQSVLLSLWEVPSQATLYFMRHFYDHLKAGHTQGEALQLSRTAMRKRFPDPYYWAVFVLYSGDPQ